MTMRFYAVKTASSWYMLMHNGIIGNHWSLVDPGGNRCEVYAYFTRPPGKDLAAMNSDAKPAKDVRIPRDFLHTWLSYSLGKRGDNSVVGYTSQVEDVFSMTDEWHFIVRRLEPDQTLKLFSRLLERELIPENSLKTWQQMLLKEKRLMEVPATRESMHAFFLRAYNRMHGPEVYIQDFLYNLFMNKPHLMERLGIDELNHIGIEFADPRKTNRERAA